MLDFKILFTTKLTLYVFFEFYVFVDWTNLISKFGKYLILLFFFNFIFYVFLGPDLLDFKIFFTTKLTLYDEKYFMLIEDPGKGRLLVSLKI